MHNAIKWLIVFATLAAGVVSGIANALFWSRFGHGPVEPYLLGGISIVVDVFKVGLLVPIALAVSARHWFRAGVGVIVFAFCVAAGLLGSAGFLATQRQATTGTAAAAVVALRAAEAERQSIETRLAAIPVSAPAATLAADLQARRQNALWTRSKECTDATVAESRQFCAEYAKAGGAQAAAVEAEALRARLPIVSATIERMTAAGAAGPVDAQADLIASVFAISSAAASLGMSGFVAVLIELISATGLWLAGVAHRPRSSVEAMPVGAPAPVPLVAAEPVTLAVTEPRAPRSPSIRRRQLSAPARAASSLVIDMDELNESLSKL